MTGAALPWLLVVSLAVHGVAHVTIAVLLARAGDRRHAAIGFVVGPLGAFWGWRAGHRAAVIVWTVALALYAAAVAIS